MPDVQNFKCIVPSCKSNGNRTRRFYGFPFPYPDIMQRWKENLHMEHVEIKRYMNVCDVHFEPGVLGKRKVLKGAVPTLHLGHSFKPKHRSQLTRHRVRTETSVQSKTMIERVREAVNRKILEDVVYDNDTSQYEVDYLEEQPLSGPPPLHFYTPDEIVLNSLQPHPYSEEATEFYVIEDKNKPIQKEHNYTVNEKEIPPLAYFSENSHDTDDSVELIVTYDDDSDHYFIEEIIEYGEDDAQAQES